ncbi:calcium-activated potassium channel subunit alpha-1-like [Engraulis encrasicolus]|uniref:calcium-activated potassium channel subunit alpha-1-like n=1 Tax=Engraulis encrasicolus TaxID=184585 RepID=UPI002FD6C14D
MMKLNTSRDPHLLLPHCVYRGHRVWWMHLGSSLAISLGGLLLLLVFRAFSWHLNKVDAARPGWTDKDERRMSVTPTVSIRFNLSSALKEWAVGVISAQHVSGQILMVIFFCFNTGSFVLYLLETPKPVEYCMKDYDAAFLIDLAFNVVHLLHFGLRFLAAQDPLEVWIEKKTLVDFLTIPPCFVMLYTRRAWLGLRFLRALNILELSLIFQILGLLKNNTSLKMSRLIAILFTTLLTSAGFIHLLESTGDPWRDFSNRTRHSYFEYIYLVIVTMSTVGYGDVYASTTLGRLYVSVFIAIGLGLFAAYVPEVVGIIINRERFGGIYRDEGKLHVVVCGHITLASVSSFMREFFHEDRGVVNIRVVFLGNFCPDQELEAFFNRWFMNVLFYQGSVLKRTDQERVRMRKASACLILCDRYGADQHHEDVTNLMRVISIKQHCPNTRVIVQMLKHNSKAYLQNVSNWEWSNGDDVICLAELKLGFMAQSCLVPGLSTLLSNLFSMQGAEQDGDQSWRSLYKEGMNKEIYTEYLSNSFTGFSFAQAAKLCFLRLHLILIGIEYQSGTEEFCVLVNPPSHIRIKPKTLGFLIASDAADAHRANYYCAYCHSDMEDISGIKPCKCENVTTASSSLLSLSIRQPSLGVLPSWQETQSHGSDCEEEEDVSLDSTGMFHWCSPVPLEEVSLSRERASILPLNQHVVVCLFGDASSSLLGLSDFMMPLRASSHTTPELKTVVFLGDPEYFRREWPSIQYFPKIYFLPGSPLCTADLRALRLESCAMCVVLSSFSHREHAESSMQDKETILACVNLVHTRFSREPPARATSLLGRRSSYGYPGPRLPEESPPPPRKGTIIPLLVELVNTNNVQFVSDVEEYKNLDSMYLTQAFAVGSVFSMDLLDSLMAATYFNANVPNLINTLVTGGDTPALEAQLAEDNRLREGDMSSQLNTLRQRSKLAQLALEEEPLSSLRCSTYKDLFVQTLDKLEILCFGLYRLLEPPNPSMKRFVITTPPGDLPLDPGDRVFCSVPFHQSHLLLKRAPSWTPPSMPPPRHRQVWGACGSEDSGPPSLASLPENFFTRVRNNSQPY